MRNRCVVAPASSLAKDCHSTTTPQRGTTVVVYPVAGSVSLLTMFQLAPTVTVAWSAALFNSSAAAGNGRRRRKKKKKEEEEGRRRRKKKKEEEERKCLDECMRPLLVDV